MNSSNENQAQHHEVPVEDDSNWEIDVPDENGNDVWVLSTDYAEQISEYYAEITGEGPFAWRVSEAAPGGDDLAFGETGTVHEAQQDAEAVCSYLIEAAHAIPDVSCGGAIDGEAWEVSRFGRVLVITETEEACEIKVCPTNELAQAMFDKILAAYLTRFSQ